MYSQYIQNFSLISILSTASHVSVSVIPKQSFGCIIVDASTASFMFTRYRFVPSNFDPQQFVFSKFEYDRSTSVKSHSRMVACLKSEFDRFSPVKSSL